MYLGRPLVTINVIRLFYAHCVRQTNNAPGSSRQLSALFDILTSGLVDRPSVINCPENSQYLPSCTWAWRVRSPHSAHRPYFLPECAYISPIDLAPSSFQRRTMRRACIIIISSYSRYHRRNYFTLLSSLSFLCTDCRRTRDSELASHRPAADPLSRSLLEVLARKNGRPAGRGVLACDR